MSAISPHSRGKSWVFQVTALCIVLGVLMGLSLKTQKQAAQEGIPMHMPDVRAALRITKQDNVKLQKELAESNLRVEELAKEQAAGVSGAKSLEESLNDAKVLAGTVAVRGVGVTATLKDSPKLMPNETRDEVIRQYVVHDYDIRAIVNELFASGAEAVAINDQRMIAISSIRCVGPVVLVNSVQVGPPYVIRAIGDPDVLEKGLTLPGGVADGLFLLDMIEVKKVSTVVVPAYTGISKFRIAKPILPQTRNK